MLAWIALSAAASPLDATGCDQLDTLEQITFTFNVEKGGELKSSRAWRWNPRTEEVVRTVGGESLTFRRGAPEGEAQQQADAQFVNDWFWLMPHCHFTWSKDVTLAEQGDEVVATYAADGGGYTPGDAYDLTVQDGRITAWTFRKGNQPEPSLTTSFTDYVPLGPVMVATDHRTPDGAFRLFFTEVSAR